MILLCQCQKTLTLVCRRFNILMLQNCTANEFRAFLCLCLSQRERKLLLFLGVCDWYTLLKTPDNMVSISSTILWGKVILCDRASCVWVSFSLLTRPWSSCEPNNTKQTDFFFPSLPVSRFLSIRLITSFITGLEGPRSQTLSQDREAQQQHNKHCLQNQVVTSPKWELGQEMLINSETHDTPVAKDVSTVICFLWGLSDLDSLCDFSA